MEHLHSYPRLAALLEERQVEIQSDWADLLRNLTGSHYEAASDPQLSSWTAASVTAIIESLRTGSKQPLMTHAEELTRVLTQLGFSVDEVVEGLLMMREAAFEHLLAARAQATTDSRDPLRQFDVASRVLAVRLTQLMTTAMSQALRNERERTALLLDVTGSAGVSLSLSAILPKVARSIRAVLGSSCCTIYLWDQEAEVFLPSAAAGEIQNEQLQDLLQQPLDPTTDSFAAAALSAQEVSTFRSASGCWFCGEPCENLGVTAAVVLPIRLVDDLLAFALTLRTAPGADPDSRDLELASGIAESVAPAVDNARRQTDTQRLLIESQKLQKATESLLEMQSLDHVLEIICSEAETLTGAAGSAIYLSEKGAVPIRTFKRDQGLSRDVDKSLMRLPLAVRGHNLGSLVLIGQEAGFDEEGSHLAARFADQAAIAIQHALLHQQHEKLVILEERQKLAHELHDSATQSIYGVTMYGEAAARHLEANQPERASTILRELQATALDALREMRLLVFELRPPMLEKEGLVAALRARLSAVEGRAGLATEFSADIMELPSARVSEALHGIAKEALNNVLKHAEASRVAIRLQQLESAIVLEITDNGAGFQPTLAGEGGGLGLQGMRERAAGIGARLTLSSSPGEGTTVRVEVSLQDTMEASGVSEETT